VAFLRARPCDGFLPDWADGAKIERAQQLFAEDGVILGPGVEPVVGREAIRAHQEEFLGAFEIQLDMQTDETEDLGKRGWGRGTFAMQLTPKSGGETTKHTGKYLNIVQRRDDGTLEIVRHCWNADQPLPRQ